MSDILSAGEDVDGAEDAGYAVPPPDPGVTEMPEPKTPFSERFVSFYHGHRDPVNIVGIALAILLVIGIPSYLVWDNYFRTTPITVTAQSFTWGRQIEVEKYKQINESGWSHPNDAYDIRKDYRFHYFYSQYAGEICSGTGTTRSCVSQYIQIPVYDWYYSYTIDRWRTERWLITGGTEQNPYWEPIPVTFNNTNVLGNEREGDEHKEVYTVHVVDDDGRIHLDDEPQAVWQAVVVGEEGRGAITKNHKLRGVVWRTE
jgi:hypothetical protein